MSRKPFAVRLKLTYSWTQRPPPCCHCGQPATKEALFKESGAIVIEKYCDGCITDPRKFKAILSFQSRAARLKPAIQ